MTPKKPSVKDRSAQAELWRRGILQWKLDSTQKDMRREFHERKEQHRRLVVLCGRQMGKSFLFTLEATAYAIQNAGAQIKYISSTKSSIQQYLLPNFDILLSDCPPDVRPTWIKGEQAWRFWNGSRILLGGTDSQHFRKLRGQRSDLTILDECGFMSDFKKTVVSVLAPQALTTGGRMIMLSSAPDTPGHDFVEFILKAREEGACIERTIYQRLALGSARQTPEEEATENARRVAQAIADSLGENTSTFRREYLNDLGATDSTRAVMPVFTDALCRGTPPRKHGVIREVKRPDHCHKYSATDLGFIDQSASLVGWLAPGNPRADSVVDYLPRDVAPAGALVIEDELVAVKKTSDEFAPLLRDMERTRFGGEAPLVRCVDAQPEQVEQLRRAGLDVTKTRNDDVEAAVDEVQKLLAKGLLVIHPRCTRLVRCIQAAVWKKDGSKLDRHPEHGHFDLMMALVYMVRNLRRWESPYPFGHDAGPRGPIGGNVSDTVKSLRTALQRRLP